MIGQKGTASLSGWDMACCDKANTEDMKSIACEVSRMDKACAEHDIVKAEKQHL